MGIFGSKQNVVPTTLACTMPSKLGVRMMHLLADKKDESGNKQCADVRSTIDRFAPLGFLESTKTKRESGVTTYTYTYAWPLPADETVARLLAGVWKYTTTRRVVKERDNTGGGLMYTAKDGRRVVPLRQMISGTDGWYPAPIDTSEVEVDVTQFNWSYVKKELEKTLTRERWEAWRSREASLLNMYSSSGAASSAAAKTGAASGTPATGVPRRKQMIVARWENTVGAILFHYQAVMREAICTLSQQCREAQTQYGFREKRGPTKRAPTKRAKKGPTKSAKNGGTSPRVESRHK
jgi:hypothetical protein